MFLEALPSPDLNSDTSWGLSIGGLVGNNFGTIDQSSSSVNVYGSANTGGLVGTNDALIMKNDGIETLISGGLITDSISTGQVFGKYNIGGLVGTNNGKIRSSSSDSVTTGFTSDANPADSIGGLVGWNNSWYLHDTSDSYSKLVGVIANSLSTGLVNGEIINAGGLVGWNDGKIINSIATGNVLSSKSSGTYQPENIGGLVGLNTRWIDENGNLIFGIISNSVASGNSCGKVVIEGEGCYNFDNVGGLVGHNNGLIEKSLSLGSAAGQNNIGGLVGLNDAGGEICTSLSKGSVTGSANLGGLVGSNSYNNRDFDLNGAIDSFGKIDSSVAIGSVTSISGGLSGALVGNNFGERFSVFGCGLKCYETTWGRISNSNGTGIVTSEGHEYGVVGYQSSDEPYLEGLPYAGVNPTEIVGPNATGIELLNRELIIPAWGENEYINGGELFLLKLAGFGYYTDLTPKFESLRGKRFKDDAIIQNKDSQETTSNKKELATQKLIEFIKDGRSAPVVSDFKAIGVLGVNSMNLPILLKLLKNIDISNLEPRSYKRTT
jgi:hypothetical protein